MNKPHPLPGLGILSPEYARDLLPLPETHDRAWRTGRDGVLHILTPKDGKVEFIVFADKTLCLVKSNMGYPALYPLLDAYFEPPAEAVLMDLDGTSVHSEHFWIWVIEQTTARLLNNPSFKLSPHDEPYVSGHSVSEHLMYCIKTYAPGRTVEEARKHYFEITRHEMKEILAGRGRPNAFTPSPDLKAFLLALKKNRIRIGLVTSGLYEKAWPEIVSAFQTLGLGDPLAFYDAAISAGIALTPGQAGTLGELSPKPHPWLYAETARVGLGITPERRHKVVGMEDSGAGVVSIRLAGFTAIGITTGNIAKSGVRPLCGAHFSSLMDALPFILGT